MPRALSGGPPVLQDGRVVLRPHTGADVDRIIEQVTDPRTLRWTSVPAPYDADDADAFLATVLDGWRSGTGRAWAIESGGRFAGTVNYRRKPGGRAELGYGLHPDARGRGVATAAARLVLDWAFDVDGVEVMGWRAAVGNLASRRVAWACGFSVDGRWRRAHVSADGHRDDEWFGSLLAGEPRQPRHPWWEPRKLVTERVVLRPWRPGDRPDAGADPAADEFALGMRPSPENYDCWLAERLIRMADGQAVFWCLADPITDRPLGGIQAHELNVNFSRGTGLLGYFLYPSARGRGLVADALELVIGHALSPRTDDAGLSGLGLHRLYAGTDQANRASQRVLRRAGFREFGTERAVLAHDDRPPTGAVSFELLAGDDRVGQTVEPTEVPVLDTARLRLRPWTAADAPRPDQELDRASLRYLPAGAQPTTETFQQWLRLRERDIDLGRAVPWCLADRSTDVPLGSIAVFDIDDGAPGNAEIGYWLFADARGHGYLAEAVPAVIEFAFTPAERGGLGLHRLHAGTDAENTPSRRVLERAGFRRWGNDHRAYARADGSLSDGAYYELLAADRGQ